MGSQADPWRDDLPLSVALGSIHVSELNEDPTAWLSMTAESHATHGQPSDQPCDSSIFYFYFCLSFVCVGSSLLRGLSLSSCSEQGLLFVAVHGPLTAVASPVAEHGL